jgi:integrase
VSADASLHELVRARLQGELGAGRVDALADLLDPRTFEVVLLWLAAARRPAGTTKRAAADAVRRVAQWLADTSGGRPVALLTAADGPTLQAWTADAAAGGLSAALTQRTTARLAELLRYAAKLGLPVADPAGAGAAAAVTPSSTPLSVVDVLALRTACASTEEQLILALLYRHAFGEVDLVRLAVDEIGRDGELLLLPLHRGGQRVLRQLDLDTSALVLDHAGGRAAGPLFLAPRTPRNPEPGAAPRTRLQVIDVTRRLARRAGLDAPSTVTPKRIRAAAVAALVDAGVPVHDVYAWAGLALPLPARPDVSDQRAAELTETLGETLRAGNRHS